MRRTMLPGATSGRLPVSLTVPVAQIGFASPVSSSKLWAIPGAIVRERCARAQASPVPSSQRAVGGDTKRQRIAGEEALHALGRGAGLVLCPAFQRVIGLANPRFAEPHQRNADREQNGGENEKKLGRGRQAGEPLAAVIATVPNSAS